MYVSLLHCKPVVALVFGVSCVTLYPVEGNIVLFKKRQELLPKVHIQGRLLVGLYPALFLPAVDPALCYAVNYVLAVSGEYYSAWLFQRGKSRYNAEELHSVVGGGAVAARKLFLNGAEAEHHSVAAGTRIAAARAVSEYLNCFYYPHPCF